MQFNRKGNSIIEVMVVIIVLTAGLVGTYNVLNKGQRLATTSENRIRAINIAREGIEAVENMRNSNWIKFSSDYANCWKTLNYDSGCIGDTTWNAGVNIMSGRYILLNDNQKWTLSQVLLSSSTYDSAYRDAFRVYFDDRGLISQDPLLTFTSCTGSGSTSCLSRFTREVLITSDSTDPDQMKVNSVVKWVDTSRSDPHEVNLEVVLTNWKKDL